MLKRPYVLTIFLANLALMGCGTKGPLYIPEQRYPQSTENNSNSHATKNDALQANIHEPSRAS
jgi:predicted small lipoprotein YifL